MSTHEHAPCIKSDSGTALLHAIADRGLISLESNSALHTASGCGECPRAAAENRCVAINSIGSAALTASQKQTIISQLLA